MKKLIVLSLSLFVSGGVTAYSQVGNSAQGGAHHSHPAAAEGGGASAKAEGGAAAAKKAGVSAQTTFDKLKTLAGDWEARDGVSYGGKPIRVSYKAVSGGAGLMETYSQVGADYIDMVTIYHLDGDALVLTHYCHVNNQVRMRWEPVTGEANAVSFNYVDATNLSVSNKEIMNKVQLTFKDKDHFTQTWTWRTTENGKTTEDKAVYNFVRRK